MSSQTGFGTHLCCETSQNKWREGQGVWGDQPRHYPWKDKSYPEWKCLNLCGTQGNGLRKDEASRQMRNLGRALGPGRLGDVEEEQQKM